MAMLLQVYIDKLILSNHHKCFNSDLSTFPCAIEYAYSMKATEKSDVYSMGIVLMEIVTGRMPTDERFGADMDMVRWVETHMEEATTMQGSDNASTLPPSEELIDPVLKPLLPNEETAMIQVLEIALLCTKTVPAERPSSRQVCDLLVHVLNDATAAVYSHKLK